VLRIIIFRDSSLFRVLHSATHCIVTFFVSYIMYILYISDAFSVSWLDMAHDFR